VYSRYPLDQARFMDLGEQGSVNVSASLRSPAGPVGFYAVHLASPTSVAATRTRNRQLQALAGLLSAARAGNPGSQPQVLVGDLNVTPFSPRFPAFLEEAGMVDARRGRGWQGTWPAAIPPLRIPIDFCLVDRASRVTGIKRGPRVGSDHLPLEVQLRIPRNSAG
jgi:endonuclease/exonuclease/phosphatase family metal-dependent hydrolase